MRLHQVIKQYLERVQPSAALQIEKALATFTTAPERAGFFRLIALAPRWTGRQPAAMTAEEKAALGALHYNLATGAWDDDQLARLWILEVVQALWQPAQFSRELDALFDTGDTRELVALYRSLALLREPERFIARAREGARSNMIPVFLAVAHHNSYPAEHFDEDGWNQMVLKAVFNACALDPIARLDDRNNPALSHMLSDYVRERWAARRDVPWDIWRCIGPCAGRSDDLALVGTALSSTDQRTRLAARLALKSSRSAAAAELLQNHQEELTVTGDKITWQSLAALD